MRLHSLSMTAFGPFAETVEVDFDTLSDAGLFLLCGATGAGKSSILDGVCFALYGEVPGDRSSAKRLRCDTAPPGSAPRVFLDVTLGGRRFHLTRSPAWLRPKKRGTGTTPQQASVLLEEILSDRAEHLSSRLDETGQLVGGLLGMTLTQFTQVALLPQGRFQDFLRAKSDDRHKLLQKLFRTRRFEDIERWLSERRLALRRQSELHAGRISGLVHRLDEVGGVPLADEVDDRQIALAATDGALIRWAEGVAEWAAVAAGDARQALGVTTDAAERATAALMTGRSLADDQARRALAMAELDRLDAHREVVDHQRSRASRARRAAPVAALHAQAERARLRSEAAASSARSAVGAAQSLLPHDPSVDDVADALSEARQAVASARAMQPVEEEVAALTTELSALDEGKSLLELRIGSLEWAATELPIAVSAAVEQVDAARAAVPASAQARQRVGVLESRLTALVRSAELASEIALADSERRAAVDVHQELKQTWLDLHERRLNGMAAEIASALAVGANCPVCGSCDHPNPAASAPGAPTSAEEKAARKRVDTAAAIREAHEDRVRALTTSLAVAQTQAGASDAEDVETELASARSEAAFLADLAGGLGEALEARDRTVAALRKVETELGAARVGRGSVTASIAGARDRVRRLLESLEDSLDGRPDLATAIGSREAAAGRLAAALEAWRVRDEAAARLAEATSDLERIAGECGFETTESAVAALLPPVELAALESAVAAHDNAAGAARAVRDDARLIEASARPAPDLAALAGTQAAATEALADAEATHRRARETAGRTEALRTQLLDALSEWAPVREAHVVAAQVAGFAEGKAADNRAQMRLSAYVLSWRLGQVVDAANLRLSRMTDQRYALEHTALKGAGETRGGLSLLVRDEWSGETRDPVTLSGGETFVVSLALALGLTDVVTQEAGGAHVGTLFVDEGFGTLDADTLDDVMDTLDSLRDGGRVVGVVSHVAEMRDRIPTRLQVDKSRTGSTVRLVRSA